MSDTTKIVRAINRFVDAYASSETRYPGLARPWAAHGHLIATNGRSMAFCPLGAIGASDDDWRPVGKVPDLASLINNNWEYGPPVPTPVVNPRWERCDNCQGCGAIMIDADAPDGWRGCKPDPDNEDAFECSDCDGKGRYPAIKPTWIDSTAIGQPFYLSDHALAMLASVGVTHLRVPLRSIDVPAMGQVGPITVLVMGMRPDETKGGTL